MNHLMVWLILSVLKFVKGKGNLHNLVEKIAIILRSSQDYLSTLHQFHTEHLYLWASPREVYFQPDQFGSG